MRGLCGPARIRSATLLAGALGLAACSGGSGPDPDAGIGRGAVACTGFCQTSNPQRLEIADVETMIAQAVAEAKARGAAATIVVVDHVGNVLALYRMAGAATNITVTSDGGFTGGLDGVTVIPDGLAVLSKALTASYFSAEQNAFSTRTAGQIIQDHFNPGEANTPSGPLFSVQISQLPCSDISQRFNGATADAGTHRAGIGFAADPGGLPLYKAGTIVGAIAVIADGTYSLDKDPADRDADLDELIATAGSYGFAAPREIRADRITLDGKTLRFSDVDFADLATSPPAAPAYATLTGADGALVALPGYSNATILFGTYFGVDTGDPATVAFGTNPSGVRPANAAINANEAELASLDGFVVVDNANNNRFPASAGAQLTAAEVQALLANTLREANRTRSQVRRPLGSRAGIHVTIVDTNGDVLGMARTRDALIDAIDVTTQKARTALLFSSSVAASRFAGVPDAAYVSTDATTPYATSSVGQYVTAYRNFLGLPTGLADGNVAWSLRALSDISRPEFPDGIAGGPTGPLSKPRASWSIFNTGLQLDLVYNAIIRHVAYVAGIAGTDIAQGNCTGFGASPTFAVSGQFAEARNGLTFFAGGLPIYKGGVLAGAIGASGDGLEQDNMVPLLAVYDTGTQLGTLSNAPFDMRADQLSPYGVHLRWAICPQSPFLDSDEQDACAGK